MSAVAPGDLTLGLLVLAPVAMLMVASWFAAWLRRDTNPAWSPCYGPSLVLTLAALLLSVGLVSMAMPEPDPGSVSRWTALRSGAGVGVVVNSKLLSQRVVLWASGGLFVIYVGLLQVVRTADNYRHGELAKRCANAFGSACLAAALYYAIREYSELVKIPGSLP